MASCRHIAVIFGWYGFAATDPSYLRGERVSTSTRSDVSRVSQIGMFRHYACGDEGRDRTEDRQEAATRAGGRRHVRETCSAAIERAEESSKIVPTGEDLQTKETACMP